MVNYTPDPDLSMIRFKTCTTHSFATFEDWKSLVICKKSHNSIAKEDEKVVNATHRIGT